MRRTSHIGKAAGRVFILTRSKRRGDFFTTLTTINQFSADRLGNLADENIYLLRIVGPDLLARVIPHRRRTGLVSRRLLLNVTLFEMPYMFTVGLIVLNNYRFI